MINYLVELLLFFMPGVLTELLYCLLKKRRSPWWARICRTLLFSMMCLALRAVFSVIGGYGGMEISVVFHGIGNYLKYCIIAAFEIAFVPPCLLILEKLLLGGKKETE